MTERLATTEFQRNFVDFESRKARILDTIGWTALKVTSSAAAILAVMNADGLYQLHEQSKNNVSITVIGEAAEGYEDSATVVLAGFGGLDSNISARALAPDLAAVGETWSVRLDNQTVDISAIAREIGQLAQERAINTISFYGVSFGGKYSLPISLELVRGDYGITAIPSHIMNDTPTSEACVRPDDVADGRSQEWLHEHFPTISKGVIARTIAELYIRQDKLFTPGNTTATIIDALKVVNSPNAASNQLLNNQYHTFLDIDLEDTLAELKKEQAARGMTPTTWTFIGNERDWVVDPRCSVRELRVALARNGFGLPYVHYIPGLKHGEPYLTPDLFDEHLPSILAESQSTYNARQNTQSTLYEALQSDQD